jgi:DNA-binding protein H-NS
VAELKPFDFSLFTDRQLRDLAYQLRAEFAKRSAKVRALARESGELTEAAGPRYRNPDNSAETWSGVGKMPSWVRIAMEAGRSLDSLKIESDPEA